MRTANEVLFALTPAQLDAFWRKVDQDAPNGCWEWRGAIHPNGYGTWTINRGGGRSTSVRPHRVSWHDQRGPIPDGLVIDHLCSNRICVNPDHLEVVAQSVNGSRIPHVTPATDMEPVVAGLLAAYSPEGVVKWWQEWIVSDPARRTHMETGVRAFASGLFSEAG